MNDRHLRPGDDSDDGAAPGSNALVALLMATVWRFRALLLLGAAAGTLLGLFSAVVTPNQYRSVGKLFVRPGIRESISPDVAFSGAEAVAQRASTREAIQNEMQVLSSRQLFDKVVARLGADELLTPNDPASADNENTPWHVRVLHAFQGWWFRSGPSRPSTDIAVDQMIIASMMLSKAIEIYPETGTNVITVAFVSDSPEQARRIVNATLDAAIELHRQVFDTMSSLDTIEQEYKNAEEVARSAEAQLREFRVEEGIYDFENQRDTLLNYLADLDRQIDSVGIEIRRRSAERDKLRSLQSSLPRERVAAGGESFVLNPNYTALNNFLFQLLGADLQLESDRVRLGRDDYQSRKAGLTRLIDETRIRLEQEGVQMKLKPAIEENPYLTQIAQRIDELEVSLQGLEQQRQQLESLRLANRAGLADFEAVLPKLRRLELEARQKRVTADRLADGVANMRTAQRLEQLNLSNVQVMHGGTFEPVKIGPQRGKLLVAGAAVGGLLAAALAGLLMLLDRKVRNRPELAWLGAPLPGLLESMPGAAGGDHAVAPLPSALAELRADIVRFWAMLPYDRRSSAPLKVAFLPCGEGADESQAAAALAVGLAAFGGEQVVVVACGAGRGWLAERLGLPAGPGWTAVLAGEVDLEPALVATPVPGLRYLAAGTGVNALPHPMASTAFKDLLDRLGARHRFVIVELPDLTVRPEARCVLGIVDGVELVVRRDHTERRAVQEAIAALRAAGTPLLGGVLQSLPPPPRPAGALAAALLPATGQGLAGG